MKKFRTAEERRRVAMGILAKQGHLPKCKACKGPDDRKQSDGLCTSCHKELVAMQKAEAAEKERTERRAKRYAGREGIW